MGGALRVELRARGTVQGVGLRPWVARRAHAHGLAGEVANAAGGVRVALEGGREAILAFLSDLRERPPSGARIESLECDWEAARGARGFRIAESEVVACERPTRVPPDVPVCAACRDELFDPGNRRHRYPFTHCAACGPRASVLTALPYDRERTSLAAFPPCAACAREYADPGDRRFHAQSLACPACGPRLAAFDAGGARVEGDAVEAAADCLRAGGVVALEGYGGFHLAADALSSAAVSRLRKRKERPAKPFALLVPDRPAAERLARLGPPERALLEGPARPVVIAPRRGEGCAALGLAPEVAPRTADLGLLLPHAPLHHLLLFAPGARPGRDAPRFPALVLTSGNLSGEPTEHDDREARARLARVADLFVTHDRVVTRFCDDPVFRSAPSGPIPVRLSRSTTPVVLPLPEALAGVGAMVAVGGDLKCAPAILARGEIHLDAHVGDLESERSLEALGERVRALSRLLRVEPIRVVHDFHPTYLGTAFARELGLPATAVQHHHAHAAACLLENACRGPALALVLDGAGWGEDGTLRGGELLLVDGARCTRIAALEPIALPGGDRAVREPWRAAARWLARAFPAGGAPELAWHARRDRAELALLARLAERGVNAPVTSSCGRLFDAAASLLDCGDVAGHEGEAAVALESLAAGAPEETQATHALDDMSASRRTEDADSQTIAAADLIAALVGERAAGLDRARAARRFHTRLAARLAAAALRAARRLDLTRVALSGGCFQNRLLLEDVRARLEAAGCEVLLHRRLPPNDGCLAAGQLAVAAARLAGAEGR